MNIYQKFHIVLNAIVLILSVALCAYFAIGYSLSIFKASTGPAMESLIEIATSQGTIDVETKNGIEHLSNVILYNDMVAVKKLRNTQMLGALACGAFALMSISSLYVHVQDKRRRE